MEFDPIGDGAGGRGLRCRNSDTSGLDGSADADPRTSGQRCRQQRLRAHRGAPGFFNPNASDVEAIYSVPVPKSGSLAEFSIESGEQTLQGEVIERARAESIYEEERSKGNEAGLASKNGYQTYEFAISVVRSQQETVGTYVYYQPLEIDTGVGRYLYALEDGGTDDAASSFWLTNSRVEGAFSLDLELRSAWPVIDVRMPDYDPIATVDRLSDGHYKVHLERKGGDLTRDFALYYRLADHLPGRVELIPFRDDPAGPGTFMLVVTPGIDLKPIATGSDYVFILDSSGSMALEDGDVARGDGEGDRLAPSGGPVPGSELQQPRVGGDPRLGGCRRGWD